MFKTLYITHEPCCSNLVITQLYPFITTQVNNTLLISFKSKSNCIYKNINCYNIEYSWKSLLGIIFAFNRMLKFNPQIIHLRGYNIAPVVLFYALITRTKIIFDPRGAFPEEVKYKKGLLYYYISRILEFLIFNFSRDIIVVSNQMRNHFIKRYKKLSNRYHLIPTFYNDSKIVIQRRENFNNTYNFVYLGSLDKWQCFEKVVNFLNELHNKNLQFHFSIITPDILTFENRYKSSLKFKNFVCMTLKPEEVSAFLGSQDIALIFRDKSIINSVSSPVKIQEYLFNRLFIITNDNIGDMSDYIYNESLGYIIRDFNNINFIEIFNSYATFLKSESKNNFHLRFNKQTSLETYNNIFKNFN